MSSLSGAADVFAMPGCSSQELQHDILSSSTDGPLEVKHRTHSGRSLAHPVGGFVISRSDLRFSRCIGEGSFGRVYLGMWRETTVAIKILFGAGVPKSLPMPLSADEVARASVLSVTRVCQSLRCSATLADVCHPEAEHCTEEELLNRRPPSFRTALPKAHDLNSCKSPC